jgi:hypothetical protein
LAEVGGLFSALTVLIGAIVFLFGHWYMQSKLIERLYKPGKHGESPNAKAIVKGAFTVNTLKS